MDITHEVHYCREITPSEFLIGTWAWSEDGEKQTGWLTFKEEGICMLVNMFDEEHPTYANEEDYCSWAFVEKT